MNLLSSALVSETQSIFTPAGVRGFFQVVFIRSKDTEVMAWQNGSSPHPNKGGSMKGICHFLGIYRGAMPTTEVHTSLLAQARQLPEAERKDFIISNLDVLYGYVPNGEGGSFPIVNGAPLSFFYTWEDYMVIQKQMEAWGVYAITYRLPLKTILPVFIGSTREAEPRPLFGVNAGGSSGTPCVEGMKGHIDFHTAKEQKNVGVWRSSESIVFPTVVSKKYWGLKAYQHQVAAIKAADPAANARNREATGAQRIPYYQQATVGTTSRKVNTESMILDPVRASQGS